MADSGFSLLDSVGGLWVKNKRVSEQWPAGHLVSPTPAVGPPLLVSHFIPWYPFKFPEIHPYFCLSYTSS